MRSEGVTLKGVLVVITVVVISAAILGWVKRMVSEDRAQTGDARKMRAIYVALSIYEGSDNSYLPPDLPTVRSSVGDDSIFRAQNDPFTKAANFPIDPACLGTLKTRSPIRVSFSYLPLWSTAGLVSAESLRGMEKNVQSGLLASYWYGSIDSTNPDGRGCTGPVVRINMDGSVYTLPKRTNPTALTADDLFEIRTK